MESDPARIARFDRLFTAHFDAVRTYGADRGSTKNLAGGNIELATVTRTRDRCSIQPAVRERASRVSASVIKRVKMPVGVGHRDFGSRHGKDVHFSRRYVR